jgi:hypothetical protein
MGYYLKHDGKIVGYARNKEEVLYKLQRYQGNSADYAQRYGGYSIVPAKRQTRSQVLKELRSKYKTGNPYLPPYRTISHTRDMWGNEYIDNITRVFDRNAPLGFFEFRKQRMVKKR